MFSSKKSIKAKTNDVLLSKNVEPLEYFLTLKPDLSGFTFEGTEKIILNIKKPTDRLEIHSSEIEVQEALFNGSQIGEVSYNNKNETITIKFKSKISSGKGELDLKFTGILNDKMRGFYRSKYHIDEKEHEQHL